MTTATAGRVSARRRIHLPRITPRRLAAVLVLAAILFGAWLWFRSSSLVQIRQVQISGVSGEGAAQIRATLRQQALAMTTLNVSQAKLESSVSGYRHVAGLRVSAHFPHSLAIAVDEQIPVAVLRSGGRQVAVDPSGLILAGASTAGLPSLPGAADTGGSRVSVPATLATLKVLGAAPYQLLSHIANARSTAKHGVEVQLRAGPVVYFGSSRQLVAKWQAADAVLADSDSAGATYIDVSSPQRPAAGSDS